METFVVRIFVPAVHGEALPLCGIIEHVASGHAESFQGVEDLMRTVARALERRAGTERAAPDDQGGS
jgi:hypothetical protein